MSAGEFQPPESWQCIRTIDAHAAGEPLRVIVSGFPEPAGETILARRRHARQHCDHLRRALMLEPRGHADMYGCILTPPATEDGDVGVLFLHNDGWSTMCGHGIIALVKVAIECNLLPEPLTRDGDGHGVVRIDTPAGRVTATAIVANGQVAAVSFENVPSFVLERDLEIAVPELGTVRCDIAYGGAFYAYVQAGDVGLTIAPVALPELVAAGMAIKRAVNQQYTIRHPDGDPDLEYLYGAIFVAPVLRNDGAGRVHSRNVCIFADGEVDRSPTGTGLSGRAAIHHSRGELALDSWIRIESLIGTCFDVRAVATCRVGGVDGIIPEVRGTAHITGRHEFFIDPRDPLSRGVLLR